MDEREFQYYLHFHRPEIQRQAARERLINAILREQRQSRNHQRRNLLKRVWSVLAQWWAARRDQREPAQSPEQADCSPAEALKVTLS